MIVVSLGRILPENPELSSMNTIPFVVLVGGLPGSGKTYFAKRLARRLSAVYVGSDQVRRRLFEDRNYDREEKDSVYVEMQLAIVQACKDGFTVVADATFCDAEHREQMRFAALAGGGKPVWMRVRAEEEVIRQRLAQPREDSEADWEVYLKLKEKCEPMQGDYLELDSTEIDVEAMIEQALEYIHQKP